MKKLLFTLLISSTFVYASAINVFADNTPIVEVDYSNHSVNISGNADAGYSYASLQVINPNKDFKNLFMEEAVLNWSDQSKTEADGSYSFSYHITGDTGVYTVIVGVDGDDNTYQTTFNYFAPDEVQKTLNEIKQYIQQKNYSGIENIIKDKSEMLQIDTTEFDKLPDYNKTLLCKGITESTVNSMNDFKELFNKGIPVQKLNLITDNDEFYNELKNIAGEKYNAVDKIFDSLDDTAKSSLIRDMMAKDYKTEEELLNDYFNGVLLTKINNIKVWGEMESFLTDTKDVTGIDLSVYNTLNNKSDAMKKMFGSSYKSVKDIKDKFDAVVKECKNAESQNRQGGGSGGSGGSGGGSSANTKFTLDTPPSNNTQPTKDIFVDLNDAEWAKESILSLYNKKIVSGDGNGHFKPNNNVTRAEFLKMVILRYNLSTGSAEVKKFDDVKENDWYYDYVSIAYSNNIVSGVSDTEFNPNGLISRQDMAVMIYRAAMCTGVEFGSSDMSFADKEDVSYYAKEAVAALSGAGVINGYDNKFNPLVKATRAQAAQILYNSYNR